MFVIAAAIGSLVLDGGTARAPAADVTPTAVAIDPACMPEPFRLPGGRPVAGERVELRRNGIARGRVCEPTRLTALLDSDPSGPPLRVVLSWRGQTVWEGRVAGQVELDVLLPGSGWSGLASVTVPVGSAHDGEGGSLWISALSAEPSP